METAVTKLRLPWFFVIYKKYNSAEHFLQI